jgi:hypothetical protein
MSGELTAIVIKVLHVRPAKSQCNASKYVMVGLHIYLHIIHDYFLTSFDVL